MVLIVGANVSAGLVWGIIGGLTAAAILIVYNLLNPKHCPDCGVKMPTTRKPANKRQALWGGWTCPNCGCELDRKGKKVS